MFIRTIKYINRIFILFIVMGLLAACHRNNPAYLGYVEAYLIYISPPVSGQLFDLYVGRGESISINKKLYQLDPEPERSNLNQAQYNLAAAQETLLDFENGQRSTILEALHASLLQGQAQLALSKITLERYQRLYEKHAVSQAALDAAQTDYSARFEQVNQLQANLAEAELGSRQHVIQAQWEKVNAADSAMKAAAWQLSQKTGVATDSGIVFDTFFRPGEFVVAGQAVLAILSPKEMRILFYVPEPHYSQIKLGQTVWFMVDGKKKAIPVQVSFVSKNAEYTPPVIYSEASKAKLVYRVEAKLPEKIALQFHPGSPVEVYLRDPR